MTNLAALDLNLLVALEALLEEGSVGRAADRVALSQPAMSHALKRLRILLGDPLLVRIGPRMQLTPRGEALRYPLKDALSRVRDLLVMEKFDATRSTRTFRLFVSDYAGDLLFPLVRKQLQHEAPGISIRVEHDGRIKGDSFELAHSVDLAIACVPNAFKGFYQQRLFTDRDACAVRRGSRITKWIARKEEFVNAKHVAVVGREFTEDPVDTWLREEGCQRNVALTVPHYLQALHVVAQSDLIAVIPERLIRANSAILGLDVMPVPLDVGTFDEYLLHPATKDSDPGCAWLRGVLQRVAKTLGPLRPQRIPRVATRRRVKVAQALLPVLQSPPSQHSPDGSSRHAPQGLKA
jgi:DNA-binding transcriptional LysR family regulator